MSNGKAILEQEELEKFFNESDWYPNPEDI